jgi:hypothetical protein
MRFDLVCKNDAPVVDIIFWWCTIHKSERLVNILQKKEAFLKIKVKVKGVPAEIELGCQFTGCSSYYLPLALITTDQNNL